jgi:hypothetical protein
MSLRPTVIYRLACLALGLACGLGAGAAHAGDTAADASADADVDQKIPETPEQALYREALEALAEGRRADASATLRRLVARSPQHAGALLELALTQCGLGNTDEAERLFAILETRFTLPRDLLTLVAETREAGCAPWQPSNSTTVTLGRGHDRNVNQGASASSLLTNNGTPIELALLPDFLPHADQYSVLGVDHVRELTSNGSVGVLQYQVRHNDQLHQYDTAALFAGIESPWRVGAWTVRTGATLGAVTLGRQLYQRQAQLQARVSPPLRLPAGLQYTLIGNASYTDYQTLTNFNSNTVELRNLLSWRRGPWNASASFSWMSDHARDRRPGGDRHGNFGSLLLRRTLSDKLSTELGYTRQSWRSASPYAPGLIEAVRDQRTEMLRAGISYQFAKLYSLQFEARAVHDRENIPIFQYNNRILQLSLLWQLP